MAARHGGGSKSAVQGSGAGGPRASATASAVTLMSCACTGLRVRTGLDWCICAGKGTSSAAPSAVSYKLTTGSALSLTTIACGVALLSNPTLRSCCGSRGINQPRAPRARAPSGRRLPHHALR